MTHDLTVVQASLESWEMAPVLSDRTLSCYERAWRRYTNFCDGENMNAFSEQGAVAYLVHCFNREVADEQGVPRHVPLSVTVIDQWVAALAQAAVAERQPTPFAAKDSYLQLVRAGYRREAARLRARARKAPPMTTEHLRLLMGAPYSCSPSFVRRRAVVALKFGLGLSSAHLRRLRHDAWQPLDATSGVLEVAQQQIRLTCCCVPGQTVPCLHCCVQTLASTGARRERMFAVNDQAGSTSKQVSPQALASYVRGDIERAVTAWPGVTDGATPAYGAADACASGLGAVDVVACDSILLFAMLHQAQGSLGWLRDRALTLVAWHLGLRSADAREHLERGDVVRVNGGYVLDLSGWKHRPTGVYRYALRPTRDPLFCAVTALDTWLAVRDRARGARPDQPLFCRTGPGNGLLATDRLEYLQHWLGLQALKDRAGVTDALTPHSNRVGFAEQALRQGASDLDIADMLRHAKITTTLGYLLPLDAKSAIAVRKLLGNDCDE